MTLLSHHAYFREGPLSELPELARAAGKAAELPKGSPDVYVRQYEKFGIDEARALREMASLKSLSGKALFILGAVSVTTEAQQALLKLFEEPAQGAVFILLVPHGSLLPTLRSRCLPLSEGMILSQNTEAGKQAGLFLKSSPKERSALIAEVLDEDKDGPPEQASRERTRSLMNALEQKLYAAFGLKKNSSAERGALAQGLTDVGRFRSYLSDRSPSLKMILEHLAATLPEV